jgi:hypothetical protein
MPSTLPVCPSTPMTKGMAFVLCRLTAMCRVLDPSMESGETGRNCTLGRDQSRPYEAAHRSWFLLRRAPMPRGHPCGTRFFRSVLSSRFFRPLVPLFPCAPRWPSVLGSLVRPAGHRFFCSLVLLFPCSFVPLFFCSPEGHPVSLLFVRPKGTRFFVLRSHTRSFTASARISGGNSSRSQSLTVQSITRWTRSRLL